MMQCLIMRVFHVAEFVDRSHSVVHERGDELAGAACPLFVMATARSCTIAIFLFGTLIGLNCRTCL